MNPKICLIYYYGDPHVDDKHKWLSQYGDVSLHGINEVIDYSKYRLTVFSYETKFLRESSLDLAAFRSRFFGEFLLKTSAENKLLLGNEAATALYPHGTYEVEGHQSKRVGRYRRHGLISRIGDKWIHSSTASSHTKSMVEPVEKGICLSYSTTFSTRQSLKRPQESADDLELLINDEQTIAYMTMSPFLTQNERGSYVYENYKISRGCIPSDHVINLFLYDPNPVYYQSPTGNK